MKEEEFVLIPKKVDLIFDKKGCALCSRQAIVNWHEEKLNINNEKWIEYIMNNLEN